jgi:hypothetical protein
MDSVPGLPNTFSNKSDNQVKSQKDDCNAAYQWQLVGNPATPQPNRRPDPPLGFYWWRADPLPFSVSVSILGDGPENPPTVFNNGPFAVNAQVIEGQAIVGLITNAKCYKVKLEVFDEAGILDPTKDPIYFDSTPLSDVNNLFSIKDGQWRVEGYPPLKSPQRLRVRVTVVRVLANNEEQPVPSASNQVELALKFKPKLDAANVNIHCDPGSCLIILTVKYVGDDFHPNEEIKPEFFAMTQNDPRTLQEKSQSCIQTGTPTQSCSFLQPDLMEDGSGWYPYVFNAKDIKTWISWTQVGDETIYTFRLPKNLFMNLAWGYQKIGLRWLGHPDWDEIRCDYLSDNPGCQTL